MVQVLPVPALASSRTVPDGSSPVMSKGDMSLTALIRSLAARPQTFGLQPGPHRSGLALPSQWADLLGTRQQRLPDRPCVIGEPGDDQVLERRARAEDPLVVGVGVFSGDTEGVVGVGLPRPSRGHLGRSVL